MTRAALPLLVLTFSSKRTEAQALGLVAFAATLPALLFSLPSGINADRFDRRRLVILAECTSAAVLIVTVMLIATDSMNIALAAAVAFVLGAVATQFNGAAQPMVPLLVEPEHLDEANGKLSAVTDGTEFVGLPLGSLLFSITPWAPFLVDALSFVGSAQLLRALPPSPPEPALAGEKVRLRPAIDHLRASRPLATLWVMLGVLLVTNTVALVLAPLVLGNRAGVPKRWYGAMLLLTTIGATVAGLTCRGLIIRLGPVRALVTAVVVNALAYLLFGFTRAWYVAGVALFVWGFSVTLGVIVSTSIRQRMIRRDLLGRVMSLYQLVVAAGGLLGASLVWALGKAVGTGPMVVSAGIVQLALVPALVVGLREVSAELANS